MQRRRRHPFVGHHAGLTKSAMPTAIICIPIIIAIWPVYLPAKLSENSRVVVTTGLAKLVESVYQYAPAIQSAANGGSAFGHEFKTQEMTNNNPKVAMSSRVQCAGPARCIVIYICQISRSNIAWTTQTPSSPPITCKMTNCTACPGRGRRAGQMPAYPLD